MDNGLHWSHNPGALLNQLHAVFGKVCARSPWDDLVAAQALGARIDTSKTGFLARNLVVAQADYLLAFTFGDGDAPKEGGTAHTWKHCKGVRLHIPISSLSSTSSSASSSSSSSLGAQKSLVMR